MQQLIVKKTDKVFSSQTQSGNFFVHFGQKSIFMNSGQLRKFKADRAALREVKMHLMEVPDKNYYQLIEPL